MTAKHEDPLVKLGLRPKLDHDLPTLLDWLSEQGLTNTADIFDNQPVNGFLPGADVLGERIALAQPTNRHPSRPRTQKELKTLEKEYERSTLLRNPGQFWTVHAISTAVCYA